MYPLLLLDPVDESFESHSDGLDPHCLCVYLLDLLLAAVAYVVDLSRVLRYN